MKSIQLYGLVKRRNTALGLLASLFLLCALPTAANVEIKLLEPDWQFLLQSQSSGDTAAQLAPNERNFAKQIKPMLTEQHYSEVAKAFSLRTLQDESAALLQLRGQVFLSIKDYAKAEEALKAALVKMPNLALAHRSLSMLYMVNKDYEQARQHLTRSIELGVADAQLYGQLAFINLNSQHAAAAISGYQQALYLDPNNIQWQQGLLYAWLNSHNFDSAQRLVEDMIEQGRHNNPQELWLMRSQIALQRNHPEQALSSLEVAIQLNPKDTRNSVVAAKLHVQHGSIPRAIELLQESLKNTEDAQSPEFWQAITQILPWLLNEERFEDVAALIKSIDKVDVPEAYAAKIYLFHGQLAVGLKDNDMATRYFGRAIKQNPVMPEALLALAKLYHLQHNYQQAENYFVRASALLEVKQQALLAHAQMQIERREFRRALELLQAVLTLDPNRRDVQRNMGELQKLLRQDQYAS